MNVPARESLTVFVDGEELPGIIVYGLRGPGRPSMEFPRAEWPRGVDTRPFMLHGDAWEVIGWDVGIDSWPRGSEWHEVIRRTLTALIIGGCVVGWVGAEGCPFSDPPDLFSPEWMAGGVLAALTSNGDFMCPVHPDEPVKYLTARQLEILRSHAVGLADVE